MEDFNVRPGMFPATFVAGATGIWRVERIRAITGESLPNAERVDVVESLDERRSGSWVLRGVTSSARYVERAEKTMLDAISPPLGRTDATRAALIPIRKFAKWWSLPQDERRAVFEGTSHHISSSMPYLPRVARRLYHSRDLGDPFDFLTWFEFAPEHSEAFDELLAALRATEEWTYVEREVEVRLTR